MSDTCRREALRGRTTIPVRRDPISSSCMDQPTVPPDSEAPAPIDALEAMGTARSMRWLRSDPVPPALIDQVLWAATRASSPDNTQPWDFVVVQNADVRERIGRLFEDMPKARPAQRTGSPAPDTADATARRTREGVQNLVATLADVPVIIFVCGANLYPPDQPDITNMYSAVYAAAQNLIVAARALGLGAAFTTLHRWVEPGLRDLLAIPDDRTMAAMIPMGWPDRPFGPLTRRPLQEVVHHDQW